MCSRRRRRIASASRSTAAASAGAAPRRRREAERLLERLDLAAQRRGQDAVDLRERAVDRVRGAVDRRSRGSRAGRARRRPPPRRRASAAAAGSRAGSGSRRRRRAAPRPGSRAPAARRRSAAPCGRRSRAGRRSRGPVVSGRVCSSSSSSSRREVGEAMASSQARIEGGNRPICPLGSRGTRTRRNAMSDVSDFDFWMGEWTVQNRRLRERLAGSDEWEEFEARARRGRSSAASATRTSSAPTTTAASSACRSDSSTRRRGSGRSTGPTAAARASSTRRSSARSRATPASSRATTRSSGRPIRVRFTWSRVTTPTPRWEQAFSDDGGETWETNWVNDFTRAGGERMSAVEAGYRHVTKAIAPAAPITARRDAC